MPSKLPNATSTKFLGQQVLIVAHVDVNMNLSKKQQISKNKIIYKSLKHLP
jgi:hypothetical protein